VARSRELPRRLGKPEGLCVYCGQAGARALLDDALMTACWSPRLITGADQPNFKRQLSSFPQIEIKTEFQCCNDAASTTSSAPGGGFEHLRPNNREHQRINNRDCGISASYQPLTLRFSSPPYIGRIGFRPYKSSDCQHSSGIREARTLRRQWWQLPPISQRNISSLRSPETTDTVFVILR
jgi:hypothetical protein